MTRVPAAPCGASVQALPSGPSARRKLSCCRAHVPASVVVVVEAASVVVVVVEDVVVGARVDDVVLVAGALVVELVDVVVGCVVELVDVVVGGTDVVVVPAPFAPPQA